MWNGTGTLLDSSIDWPGPFFFLSTLFGVGLNFESRIWSGLVKQRSVERLHTLSYLLTQNSVTQNLTKQFVLIIPLSTGDDISV